MLNISKNNIQGDISISDFKSGKQVTNKNYFKKFNQLSLVFLFLLIVILFLPWTQNINGKGYVTTLKPNQRPQTIQSQIPGRIEQWFVQEGSYVNKGDTIVRISEIKSDYFDDNLALRTEEQIKSKQGTKQSYGGKIGALESQILALKSQLKLKLQQANNKLIQVKLKTLSDSTNFEAAKINANIAETQFERTKALHLEGLKAKKDVEEKRLKLQATQAKLISAENKFIQSKNSILNASIELSRIKAEYLDKIAKSNSEIFTTKSKAFTTEAEISKLENSFTNYTKRNSLKFITAPQNGFINRTVKNGIGEAFKEGESIATIMPADYSLAVETYIKPIDLPLIHIGEKVRVQFDGWPAIVFSGWESLSYGTYGAKVVAIENYISNNGMYRILLSPDENKYQWPKGIRVGSGAKTIALLNDVPIWYELWRNLNGFPPNFYNSKNDASKKSSKK